MKPKISILIDVGEAYDRLAILEVKKEKLDINKQFYLIDQINILQSQISHSIGWDLAAKIFESKQYRRLKETNKQIFESIDRLRAENLKNNELECSTLGVDIDEYNTLRFEFKNELQKKFFNDQTEEIKN